MDVETDFIVSMTLAVAVLSIPVQGLNAVAAHT